MMHKTGSVMWPHLFYVGPGKTGSTTMYHILSGIRGMYVPPVKGLNYFLRDITKKEYFSFYKGVKDEKIIAHSSQCYFSSAACRRIRAVRPDAKILITLRDPVEQLFSRFLLETMTTKLIKNIHTFTQSVDRFTSDDYGALCRNDVDNDRDLLDIKKSNKYYYSEPLSVWISTFGRHNVKVILLEDLVENPRDTVAGLLDFVGGGVLPTLTRLHSRSTTHSTYAPMRCPKS